ncbi:MAG: nuclear transport factor 2 family protein [Sandaracinobacteroides sp.]
MSIQTPARIGLDRWQSYILSSHDKQALWDMLHPEMVFESPVVHTPQQGREISFKYLASADLVLGGPDFSYVNEWLNETSAVLEFKTEIDGVKVNGIDMITWDAEGCITSFKVMVRPLKAVNMLHQMMGLQLAALAAAKT